jgi:membrane protein DedA with SNARE-associated domain
MTVTELIEQYGYIAVVVGTFFEGETILVMAGFAVHHGHLTLPGVVLSALLGSLLGDQSAFFAGRRYGARVVARFPRLRPGVERATKLLARHETALLLGFRFVYGIRLVTPIAAGLGKIKVLRFFILNLLGAVAWAVAVTTAGYVFGKGVEAVLSRAKRFEEAILIGLAVSGAVLALVSHLRRRRASTSEP